MLNTRNLVRPFNSTLTFKLNMKSIGGETPALETKFGRKGNSGGLWQV